MTTKSWLIKNKVVFTEKRIEQDNNAEELRSLGYKVTPGIQIGSTTIVGYNPKKLSDILL